MDQSKEPPKAPALEDRDRLLVPGKELPALGIDRLRKLCSVSRLLFLDWYSLCFWRSNASTPRYKTQVSCHVLGGYVDVGVGVASSSKSGDGWPSKSALADLESEEPPECVRDLRLRPHLNSYTSQQLHISENCITTPVQGCKRLRIGLGCCLPLYEFSFELGPSSSSDSMLNGIGGAGELQSVGDSLDLCTNACEMAHDLRNGGQERWPDRARARAKACSMRSNRSRIAFLEDVDSGSFDSGVASFSIRSRRIRISDMLSPSLASTLPIAVLMSESSPPPPRGDAFPKESFFFPPVPWPFPAPSVESLELPTKPGVGVGAMVRREGLWPVSLGLGSSMRPASLSCFPVLAFFFFAFLASCAMASFSNFVRSR